MEEEFVVGEALVVLVGFAAGPGPLAIGKFLIFTDAVAGSCSSGFSFWDDRASHSRALLRKSAHSLCPGPAPTSFWLHFSYFHLQSAV